MSEHVIRIDCMAEPIEGECHQCRFDALVRVKGYMLEEQGVSTVAEMVTCGRCAAEDD